MMPAHNALPSRDGSERVRLRRCIRVLGQKRVAEILGVNRGTVTNYAAEGEVLLMTETIIVLRLADLEQEVERVLRAR